jgi:uncharacterized RDD family membrane protein YckC
VTDLPEPGSQPGPSMPPSEPAPAEPSPPQAPGPEAQATPPSPIVSWEPSKPSGARLVPGAPGLVFAGTAERFVAFIIDVVVAGLLAVAISLVLGVASTTTRTTGTTTSFYASANSLVEVVVFLVYFVGFWTGGRRATPAQRLLHLQVGNAFDGKPLTVEQALSRWVGLGLFLQLGGLVPGVAGLASLASLVWSIVLIVSTVTSPTKQGLHDRFANTAVVRPVDQSSSALVIGCLVIFAVFLLLGLIGLIFLGSNMQEILSRVGQSI